jgi:hypothetical protein
VQCRQCGLTLSYPEFFPKAIQNMSGDAQFKALDKLVLTKAITAWNRRVAV